METEVALITDLAARIKWIRQTLNVTQPEFSEATGIPVPNLRMIEQGRTLNPTINVAGRIASAYGVNLKWLILGEGPTFESPSEVEKELNRTREELLKSRQQVDRWKNEATNKDVIIEQFVKHTRSMSATKKGRPGKHDDVVHSPLQRGRFGRNFSQLGHVGGYIAR